MAPIAPPALLNTHSSSVLRYCGPTFSSSSVTMKLTTERVSSPCSLIARCERSCRCSGLKM